MTLIIYIHAYAYIYTFLTLCPDSKMMLFMGKLIPLSISESRYPTTLLRIHFLCFDTPGHMIHSK